MIRVDMKLCRPKINAIRKWLESQDRANGREGVVYSDGCIVYTALTQMVVRHCVSKKLADKPGSL